MRPHSPVVLLVEGEVVARHLLAEYLRGCGFVVFEAANGDEAKRAFDLPKLRIAVVLADMATTGSGFALRQWITASHPGTDVILAGSIEKTAHDAATICKNGPALAKPYEHLLVLDRIRAAMDRRDKARRRDPQTRVVSV